MADNTTELEVLNQIVDVLGGQSGQYETVVPVLQQIKELLAAGITDPEAIAEAVAAWLDDHPEATTTVQDGSITGVKIADDTIPDAKLAQTGGVLENKVDKDGEHQVTPQNIEGVTYTKTESETQGEDFFSESYLGENGYYASINQDGLIAHSAPIGVTYRWYAIPVYGNTKYTFTQARFGFLAKGNTLGSEAIGELLQNVSEMTTTADTAYLILSYRDTVTSVEVHQITTSYTYSDFVMPSWMVDGLTDRKQKFASVEGNIASGGNLQLLTARNNLRKGERIVFEGDITSFDSLKIGLTFAAPVDTAANQINTFLIDGANISYYARNTSTPVVVAHGLTISDNIQVIWEMSATATCKITLLSDGNSFIYEFENFARVAIGNPFVLSVNTVLSNCKLSWTCTDLEKRIWIFGDSYLSYNNERWTYYLHQYGYDHNCLLDGYAGEGSVNGRVSFSNLLQFGTPKLAVWCLGMNDTSDTESAPAANWVTNRDLFLQYCQDNNVTPIFGTIPTVPTINNEQKNSWIRSSGYRYIDFAKAVGADSSGNWYNGMLSNDGIHPTMQGARALYSQVLADLPEIFIPA